jgi:uncharacterized phage protein (TIGR02218 family)
MRSAPDSLIALLNSSQQFTPVDLYQITLINGTVINYTSYDIDVTDSEITYKANGVLIERSRVRTVIGVEVDSLDLVINPHPNDLVGGVSFLQMCAAGQLDGATLTLRRAFLNALGENMGSFINFSGRIADMNMTRSQVDITVKSDLELLNVKLPRNLYQTTCLHTLYDDSCGLNRADWGVAGTVLSGTKIVLTSALTTEAGHFDLGYIIFNTGVMAGTRRTVKTYSDGVFNLLNPLPTQPGVGDTFTAYAGCDRTQNTCGYPDGTAITVTGNTTSNTLNKTAHGMVFGNKIRVSNTGGALPAPLVAGLDYYAVGVTADAFQLSLSKGGAAIDLTTAGTGVNKAIKRGKFNNISNFRAFPFVPAPETTR